MRCRYSVVLSFILLISAANAEPYDYASQGRKPAYEHRLGLGAAGKTVIGGGEIYQPYGIPPTPSFAAAAPPPIKAAPAPSTQEICNSVPVSSQKVCFADIPASEPYECPQTSSREVCEVQSRDTTSRCYKISNQEVEYACPQQSGEQQLCYDVPYSTPKMCKQQVVKKVQQECTKPLTENVCKAASVEVPSKCFRTKEINVPYKCSHVEPQNVCKSDYHSVPSLCKREIVTQQPYSYQGVAYENVCENVLKTKQGTCQRTVYDDEEYPCSEIVMQKECKDVTRVVTKPCTTSTTQTRMVDCSTQEQRLITKQCPRTKKQKVMKTQCYTAPAAAPPSPPAPLYPSQPVNQAPLRQKLAGSMAPRRLAPLGKKGGCYEVPIEVDQIVMEECSETVTVTVPKSCPKTESVPVQSVCPSSETDQVCVDVPKTVTRSCKRKAPRIENYQCTDTVTEQECKSIEKPTKETAYRPTTSSETYSCEATELIETCSVIPNVVESTCQASVMQAEEYPCTTTVMQQRCDQITTNVASTCLGEQFTEEEYPCPFQSTDRKCESFPIYKNTGICTTVIQKVEEFDCMKTELQQVCRIEEQTTRQTCYRSTMTQKEYTCFENSTKAFCETVFVNETQTVNPIPSKQLGGGGNFGPSSTINAVAANNEVISRNKNNYSGYSMFNQNANIAPFNANKLRRI